MSLLGTITDLMQIETRQTMLPPPPGPAHPSWEESWTWLFQRYAPAMRRYVRGVLKSVLKRAISEDEAEEVVQEYLSACIDKGWLSRDVGTIRSFRRYLKVQLYRFVHDYLDRKLAKKRAPEGVVDAAALADLAIEPDDADAIAELDRGFVEVACEEALRRLGEKNEEQAAIVRDLLRSGEGGSADLADLLGRPQRQLPVLRHRARRAFAVLFIEELKATTRDLASFEELLTGLERYLG